MAQQIKVNSSTGNIQIQISRGAIGPTTTANVANTANNLNAASTANVFIGGGVANYVLQTDGAGNTSWVAQTGGGATNPAGANTQIQFNDQGSFGAEPNFTYDKATDVLTADHFSGEGGNLSNIQGANVSGAVANATHATISDSANSVAVANVAGIGNIATVNLDGNVSNVLAGDGTFIAAGGGGGTYGDSNVVSLLNAFGSNTITTTGLITGDGGGLSNIAGANISGAVANATHATVADSANAVAGANVTGEVPFAAVANSVNLANVVGAGNIASINIDGNVSNVLRGDGTFSSDTAATPGGSNTQVQYNDNGAFGGEAVFTYDDVTDTLTAPNITATTQFEGDINGAVLLECFNNTGSTINKGQLVYLPGGNNGDQPYIDLADNSDINKMPAFGVAKQNIAPSTSGEVVTLGELTGLNLTGFTTGDTLYVNGVGAFQNTAPTGEADFIQSVGKVINGGTGGAIEFTGAGRVNQTPNLDDGNIFIGNATNQATTANLYGEINTHLAAFGSNTITTTGNITTGNLEVVGTQGNITLVPDTEILDSKRFTTINRATETVTLTAGSFLVGELYIIVTTGTTDFTLIGAPDSNPGTAFFATGVGSGTGTAKYFNSSNQVFVTDDYIQQSSTKFSTYANTSSGHLAEGASMSFDSYRTIGNTTTDNIVASQISFSAYSPDANLVGPQTGTGTNMTMGGPGTDGFLIVQGTNATDSYNSEVWKQFQYRPKAMGFIRRNGNADNRLSSAANDETSLNFYNTQNRTGRTDGQLWNYPAKMGSKVDPTWVDPGGNFPATGVPNGLFFVVVDENFANLEHRMYANGDTVFNSSGGGTPITLGYNGVITGDGGGLSNISATAGTQIVNGTSNVSVALNSNVTVGVNNFTNVLDIGQTVTTAPAFTATTGLFTGDGGGLSNVSATATPGGFFDTIQFNNGGTLDGNSSFQFIPGTIPEVQLNGSAGSSPARMLLQDAILNIYTQDLSGGYSPFSFDTHNNAGGFMEPINYKRTRGTRAAPTAVQAGDQVKNERLLVYADSGNTNLDVGGQTSTVQANDGVGNVAVTTTIRTAKPASGPNSQDKIFLDTEFVQTAGNIQMNNTGARFTAGRIAQVVNTFATLPATPVIGERAVISDASPLSGITYGDIISSGGGSAVATCYWDGSNWRAG